VAGGAATRLDRRDQRLNQPPRSVGAVGGEGAARQSHQHLLQHEQKNADFTGFQTLQAAVTGRLHAASAADLSA
jgi:hypothetical protein